jgi:hypothetical protein
MNAPNSMAPAADGFPWEQVIPIVPDLLWLLGAVILVLAIGVGRIRNALARATKIGVAGLEIELRSEVEAAGQSKSMTISGPQAARAARRLAAAADLLSGSRLLWVDDIPDNNSHEIETLRGLSVAIDLAQSTDAARDRLRAGAYDLVISDMTRGPDKEAGLELIPLAAGAVSKPSLIYYVGVEAPVPSGVFGLTTRPDELFHLVVDALSRRRG